MPKIGTNCRVVISKTDVVIRCGACMQLMALRTGTNQLRDAIDLKTGLIMSGRCISCDARLVGLITYDKIDEVPTIAEDVILAGVIDAG